MSMKVTIRNEEDPAKAPLARAKVETYTNGCYASTNVLKPGEASQFTIHGGQHLFIEAYGDDQPEG